jgi:hypothetical protein
MAKGRFFFGFLMTVASALGITYLLGRVRRQPRVEMYFDDGSMLAVNNKSSEMSARITTMADVIIKRAL